MSIKFFTASLMVSSCGVDISVSVAAGAGAGAGEGMLEYVEQVGRVDLGQAVVGYQMHEHDRLFKFALAADNCDNAYNTELVHTESTPKQGHGQTFNFLA